MGWGDLMAFLVGVIFLGNVVFAYCTFGWALHSVSLEEPMGGTATGSVTFWKHFLQVKVDAPSHIRSKK